MGEDAPRMVDPALLKRVGDNGAKAQRTDHIQGLITVDEPCIERASLIRGCGGRELTNRM